MLRTPLIISTLLLLAGFPLIIPTPSHADVGNEIASAYGVQHFGDIEILNFTFNAKVGEKNVERSWKWMPKRNIVDYRGSDGKTLHLDLANLEDEESRAVHAWFINDSYWLLFPFHQKL